MESLGKVSGRSNVIFFGLDLLVRSVCNGTFCWMDSWHAFVCKCCELTPGVSGSVCNSSDTGFGSLGKLLLSQNGCVRDWKLSIGKKRHWKEEKHKVTVSGKNSLGKNIFHVYWKGYATKMPTSVLTSLMPCSTLNDKNIPARNTHRKLR